MPSWHGRDRPGSGLSAFRVYKALRPGLSDLNFRLSGFYFRVLIRFGALGLLRLQRLALGVSRCRVLRWS